jgi:hypothetical protein
VAELGQETAQINQEEPQKGDGGKWFWLILSAVVLMFALIPWFFAGVLGGSLTGLNSKTVEQVAWEQGLNTAIDECWNLADSTAMTAEQIDAFLRKKGSPLAGTGADVLAAAREMQINPALMIAINGKESTFGKYGRAVPNKNPGNVKIGRNWKLARDHNIHIIGQDGDNHSIFPTWKDGWKGQGAALWSFIHSRKLRTIYDVNAGTDGRLDGKGGYAEDTNWHVGVKGFMQEILPCQNPAPDVKFGSNINGSLYPPLGDKRNDVNCPRDPHKTGAFFPIPRGGEPERPSKAVDWGGGRSITSTQYPIYSAFDGKIADYQYSFYSKSGSGWGGSLVRTVSIDGNYRAVYAHIKADPSIRGVGSIIKKGQLIGYISPREQSFYTLSWPHLHFQLWIGEHALTTKELNKLLGKSGC